MQHLSPGIKRHEVLVQLDRFLLSFRQEFCSELNTLAVAVDLPPKILIHIFHSVINTGPTELSDMKSLLSVTHVCRKWREVACGNSPYSQGLWAWGRIDPSILRPELLDLILHRAGSRSLRVSLKLRNAPQASVSKDGLNWVIKNFGRIEAMALESDVLNDFAWLPTANGDSIRALELSYAVGGGGGGGPLAKLCDDCMPRLRELRLSGVRLPWQGKRYLNLTSLTIVVPGGVLDDDQSIIDIFEHSPNIEKFRLFSTRGISVIAHDKLLQTGPQPKPIPLHQLRLFAIQLPFLDVRYILRRILIPQSTQLSILAQAPSTLEWCSGQPGTLPEQLQTILPEDLRCLQALTTVKTLIVNAEERTVDGWVIPHGGIDKAIPNFSFKILPGLVSTDRYKAIADDLFSTSSAFLLGRLTSPFSLSQLTLRGVHKQFMDAQQYSGLILTNLTFDNWPSDIVTSIYDKIQHSETSWRSFENVIFKNMTIEAHALRNLLTAMERFGKKPFRSLMSSCIVTANSKEEAMEIFGPLSVAGAIEPNSIISVNWNGSTHAIRCSFSEANGWTWAEMQG